MIDSKIKKLIESVPVALATVMSNGKPNVIGVAYVKVIGSKLLITDNFMNQTVKDIRNNPAVAVVVWNKDMEGYKLIGRAEYFSQGKWAEKVKEMPENEDCPAKGAILVQVKKVIKSA